MIDENARHASLLTDGWRMAVGTLTAVPVRPPSRIDRRVAGRAMLLAPLAALPVAVAWIVGAILSPMAPVAGTVLAVAAITGTTLSTRAMHLDGLADTADGLSASYDRERALEVMKTGDVGPSGAAAIALVLLLQAAATSTLYGVAYGRPGAAIVLGLIAFCTSRFSLALACTDGVPPARPGGLGATVAGTVSRGGALLVGVVLAGVGAGLLAVVGATWWVAPVVVLGGVATTAALVRRCVRRLGGITGDVLGASVEASFAVALSLAALLSPLALPL